MCSNLPKVRLEGHLSVGHNEDKNARPKGWKLALAVLRNDHLAQPKRYPVDNK